MLRLSVAENPDGFEEPLPGILRAWWLPQASEDEPLPALAEHPRALAAFASAAEAIAIYDGASSATLAVEFFTSLAGEETPIRSG